MKWQNLEIPQLEGFTGFVPPEGTGSIGVAIIGEAPGEMEARFGKPFYEGAPAGSCLSRLLKRAGLDRERFIISNSVWSRPPGNYLDGARYEGEAIASYAPFRERLFSDYRPRVLVALGGVALRTLTSYGGKGASITKVGGYVLDGPWDGTWVIGALHPSALVRGEQHMSGVVIWALQRAVDIACNGFCRTQPDYLTHPSLDDALAFERQYDPSCHFLSYDIEVANGFADEEEAEDRIDEISGQITRISLCYDGPGGRAITLIWQRPYIDIARRMLSSLGPKRVWNVNFDNPRLKAAGAPVAGRIYDTMWGWKHLQPTLPRSLGFVAPFYGWTGEPWKHTSDSEPERYSCQDAHALQMIGDGVDQHLKQKGMWDVYERHVVDLGEVLGGMADNGLPYSAERARAFEEDLRSRWDRTDQTLQLRVPPEVRRPKQKGGYKRPPIETAGLAQRKFYVLGKDLTDAELTELGGGPKVEVAGIYQVTRWCVLEPFNPGSPGESGQMADLIKLNGHSIGRNRKTKKGSVDDDTLKKLMRKLRNSRKEKDREFAEVLQLCRECRQYSKVLGTYVKGWRPGSDGRIHSTPGFWGDMFRISWRRPNIAATIQDKQEDYVAQGFRKCVATAGNRVLLEADWRGIEAVLVGWFARDPDYQRLARLGVHSFMASHMLGRPADVSWSDEDLTAYFKEIKKGHKKIYDDAKHTIHGSNYGMGPHLLSDMYEMPLAEAKRLQDFYFGLFPRLLSWRKATLDQASRECKLRNPFGYEMPFWEVYKWDSKGKKWTLGEDAKGAIAFLPRDTAAAMLKETLLRLRPLVDEGILLACTHDSVTCEVEERDLDRVAEMVKLEMERPVPQLDNLSIGVELKAGAAWHESEMRTLEVANALVRS